MSLSVTKSDMSGYSATLPEKMYEDVRGIVIAPAEVLQRGIERSKQIENAHEAARRERAERKDLIECIQEIAEHEMLRESPPLPDPEKLSGWFQGKAHRQALYEEEEAARERLKVSEDLIKHIEIEKERALKEHEAAVERLGKAKEDTDTYVKGKHGWFWWR